MLVSKGGLVQLRPVDLWVDEKKDVSAYAPAEAMSTIQKAKIGLGFIRGNGSDFRASELSPALAGNDWSTGPSGQDEK